MLSTNIPILILYASHLKVIPFCIFLQILCVVAAVFAVIMYRIIIVTVLYASTDDIIRQNAKITTTATSALLNLVAIMILNKVSLYLSQVMGSFKLIIDRVALAKQGASVCLSVCQYVSFNYMNVRDLA